MTSVFEQEKDTVTYKLQAKLIGDNKGLYTMIVKVLLQRYVVDINWFAIIHSLRAARDLT